MTNSKDTLRLLRLGKCDTCGSEWSVYKPGGPTWCYTCSDKAPNSISGVEYNAMVEETAIYPESGSESLTALMYAVLGLTGEAGEVADKLKKVLREDRTLDEARDGLVAELGDVVWYVYRVATELGVDLPYVQAKNADKLLSRKARDVLKGDGDNR